MLGKCSMLNAVVSAVHFLYFDLWSRQVMACHVYDVIIAGLA